MDCHLHYKCILPLSWLKNEKFKLVKWYKRQLEKLYTQNDGPNDYNEKPDHPDDDDDYFGSQDLDRLDNESDNEPRSSKGKNTARDPINMCAEAFKGCASIEINGQQVKAGTYPSIQRNTAHVRDSSRNIPKPVIIVVKINGHPAHALIDSGLLGDFMSSTLADQLKISKTELKTPLTVQLAVQGSRSKINYGGVANFTYQSINEEHYFDIINILSYNLILGMPWLFQFQITMGINPAQVVVGTSIGLPMEGPGVAQLSAHLIGDPEMDAIGQAHLELFRYAQPMC